MSLRNICVVALLWGGYWIFAPMANRDLLFSFINALAVSIAAGVFIAYIGGVKDTFFKYDLSAGHYLTFGILCVWLGLAGRLLWQWIWRWAGKPDWMEDHLVFAFCVYVMITGGILHLTAPGAVEGVVPRRNWMYVGIVVAIAVAMTFLGASLFHIGGL